MQKRMARAVEREVTEDGRRRAHAILTPVNPARVAGVAGLAAGVVAVVARAGVVADGR